MKKQGAFLNLDYKSVEFNEILNFWGDVKETLDQDKAKIVDGFKKLFTVVKGYRISSAEIERIFSLEALFMIDHRHNRLLPERLDAKIRLKFNLETLKT